MPVLEFETRELEGGAEEQPDENEIVERLRKAFDAQDVVPEESET